MSILILQRHVGGVDSPHHVRPAHSIAKIPIKEQQPSSNSQHILSIHRSELLLPIPPYAIPIRKPPLNSIQKKTNNLVSLPTSHPTAWITRRGTHTCRGYRRRCEQRRIEPSFPVADQSRCKIPSVSLPVFRQDEISTPRQAHTKHSPFF